MPIDQQNGYGFIIEEQTPQGVVNAIKKAREAYRTPQWARGVKNALAQRFSWEAPGDSVGKYIEIYQRVLK